MNLCLIHIYHKKKQWLILVSQNSTSIGIYRILSAVYTHQLFEKCTRWNHSSVCFDSYLNGNNKIWHFSRRQISKHLIPLNLWIVYILVSRSVNQWAIFCNVHLEINLDDFSSVPSVFYVYWYLKLIPSLLTLP